jgi:hypothetical protein
MGKAPFTYSTQELCNLAALCHASQGQDAIAFNALAVALGPGLKRLAKRYSISYKDTFFFLHQALLRPLNHSHIPAMELLSRVRSSLWDELRKEKRRLRAEEFFTLYGEYFTEAAPIFEERRDLIEVLGRLDARGCLLLLGDARGMTGKELAPLAGIAVGSTRVLVHRAKRRARAFFAPSEPPRPPATPKTYKRKTSPAPRVRKPNQIQREALTAAEQRDLHLWHKLARSWEPAAKESRTSSDTVIKAASGRPCRPTTIAAIRRALRAWGGA